MTNPQSNKTVSEMPTWQGFLAPTLHVLTDGRVWDRRSLATAVFDHMDLTEANRNELLPSGKNRARNRLSWALNGLVRAEVISRPKRAHCEITDTGRRLIAEHPTSIDEKILETIPAFRDVPSSNQSSAEAALPATDTGMTADDPFEQIESGVSRLHDQVTAELLTRLRDKDPEFLEHAVLKVLVEMGYGGLEKNAQRIGGSGDGGVDGVINQDKLGLDKIYVQAKRYAADRTIQRPDVQGFVGALHGQNSSRGIFITTSSFSSGAIEYARTIGTQVILIDGSRLASLMIDYGVGVQTRQTYTVVEIDDDFFDDGSL